MPSLRTVGLVASFELRESLRSRWALGVLLLYLLAAAGTSAAFIRAFEAIRAQLGGELEAARSVVQSEQFQRELSNLVGSAEVARALVSIPPLALFYFWIALTLVPLLVVLTSSDAIASDRQSGAARFVLFRADRLSWSLGKLLGQLMLMIVGVFLGAAGSFGLGVLLHADFAAGPTAWWLARFTVRACAYGAAHLGLAFCASQWARTPARARWLGLALLLAVRVTWHVLNTPAVRASAPGLADSVGLALPSAHYLALWQPSAAERTSAMLALVLIGIGFFVLGHTRFARQDA